MLVSKYSIGISSFVCTLFIKKSNDFLKEFSLSSERLKFKLRFIGGSVNNPSLSKVSLGE